jgi:SAM-dependent methyltransferase
MFLVTNSYEEELYVTSGRQVAETLRFQLAGSGIDLERQGRILDFGCGTGRVLRHFRGLKGPRLYGCDYNAAQIAWAAENLPFVQFSANSADPPLPYEEGAFDLVYCFSVFTHLAEAQQLPWMAELRRVLKPGGHLYFTVHGDDYSDAIPPEKSPDYRAGRLAVRNPEYAGTNGCAAFHPERYVRETLSKGFEIIARFPSTYPQDSYIMRRTA